MALLVGLALLGAVQVGEAGESAPLDEVADIEQPTEEAPPLNVAIERRLDCISWYESRGTPSARNRSSGAAGEFQFLWSTWLGTPQGRAGLSPYDAVAARQAARWMLLQGRAREWVPVRWGWC